MNALYDTHYDLIVVGGGIAGSMAAIAAGREGLSVLLIEEEGFLGGSLTAGGTGPMMTFHAGETQVVRGLPDEMIQRLMAKGLSVGHIPGFGDRKGNSSTFVSIKFLIVWISTSTSLKFIVIGWSLPSSSLPCSKGMPAMAIKSASPEASMK